MPWLVAPRVTAASPVRTPARAWIAGPRERDRVDELEGGPDGALGVVLVRDGRAPDGHHRVADELLDRAAVPRDDVPRQVEVAGEEFAHLLGVPLLGERREADEVGEQDRDEAALGDAGGGTGTGWAVAAGARGVEASGRALAAELLTWFVQGAAAGASGRER